MAYYHCVEDDRILSTNELLAEFEQFRSEGSYLDESFADYLTGCMWYNNGSLTPLLNHIDNLRRDLARVESRNDPDDADWLDTLRGQIAECERYYLEV